MKTNLVNLIVDGNHEWVSVIGIVEFGKFVGFDANGFADVDSDTAKIVRRIGSDDITVIDDDGNIINNNDADMVNALFYPKNMASKKRGRRSCSSNKMRRRIEEFMRRMDNELDELPF